MLFVEDNDDHWIIMQRAIQQVMPEVTLVRVDSAQQMLLQVAQWGDQEWDIPKLIMLDIYLPNNEDGWQLLIQLKQHSAPINLIPVVMCSSSSEEADITNSYQLGATSYLVKPLTLEGWVNAFENIRDYWWQTATLPPFNFYL